MAECKRCGACCEAGGPVLHLEDLALIHDGLLPLDHLVTLRAGELARDPVACATGGEPSPLGAEIVRMKGSEHDGGDEEGGASWRCPLLVVWDGEGDCALTSCGLHPRRPAQCGALDCRDTSALGAMYETDRLSRAVLFANVPELTELMAEHERKVPLTRVAELCLALRSSDEGSAAETDALDELRGLMAYDRSLRETLAEELPTVAPLLSLMLGRPLAEILVQFGLELADGRLSSVPPRAPAPCCV